MDDKTISALKWITKILNKNNIPYMVGGGVAVSLYGADRIVDDIDISVSGKYFPTIIGEVKDYIITNPTHYKDGKWDCTTLSLKYNDKEIDLTDVDTLLMSNKERTEWIKNKQIYSKFAGIVVGVDDIKINLMNPRALIEYKKELDGEKHKKDIDFLQEYIKKKDAEQKIDT